MIMTGVLELVLGNVVGLLVTSCTGACRIRTMASVLEGKDLMLIMIK
jgi:hypothetical protein